MNETTEPKEETTQKPSYDSTIDKEDNKYQRELKKKYKLK